MAQEKKTQEAKSKFLIIISKLQVIVLRFASVLSYYVRIPTMSENFK